MFDCASPKSPWGRQRVPLDTLLFSTHRNLVLNLSLLITSTSTSALTSRPHNVKQCIKMPPSYCESSVNFFVLRPAQQQTGVVNAPKGHTPPQKMATRDAELSDSSSTSTIKGHVSTLWSTLWKIETETNENFIVRYLETDSLSNDRLPMQELSIPPYLPRTDKHSATHIPSILQISVQAQKDSNMTLTVVVGLNLIKVWRSLVYLIPR